MSKTPKGFRDLLPEKARKKEDMVNTIISVYRRYGFLPLETPVVEFQKTLAPDVTDFNLFHVHSTRERKKGNTQELAMRFDLTVPLARVMSDYHRELPKPFKRYQLGEVFRGEKPQKGRYRQFTQLDADIVGSDSIYTDIDLVLMMHAVMSELGVPDFTIRVNSRKVLNLLPEALSFDGELLKSVLIVLDKRDKVSEDELAKMLLELGLSDEQVKKLIDFGSLSGERKYVLEKLKELFSGAESFNQVADELTSIDRVLSDLGKDNIIFDMSIIRGLGYYTGTIFETTINEYPEFGSVYSGGRYDHLIEKLGGPSVPAIGASVGVDRLLALLEEVSSEEEANEGYVVLSYSDEFLAQALKIAESYRAKGFVCDVLTSVKKMAKQFEYAERKGYAKAIILGEDEMAKGVYLLRDLKTREQEEIVFEK